jgi:hypothetical protein
MVVFYFLAFLPERILKETSPNYKRYCRSYPKNRRNWSEIASLEVCDKLRSVLGVRVMVVYSLFYLMEIICVPKDKVVIDCHNIDGCNHELITWLLSIILLWL